MRILFVSGVASGGSFRSTHELATRVAERGHATAELVRSDHRDARHTIHKRAINLAVKLGTSPLGRSVELAAARIDRRPRRVEEPRGDEGSHAPAAPGRRPRRVDGSQRCDDSRTHAAPVERWETTLPENALGAVRRSFRPDVVVASSLARTAWVRIRAELAREGIPSVLYLREEAAVGHLAISSAPPDLLLANARTYADAAAAFGTPAVMIPSVVALDRCLVETTRETVLFVNPVPSYGVDRAVALAKARPDLRFAFVEWWRLDPTARAALGRSLADLANVELRPTAPGPRALYSDARVLLAPFVLDMRPRVVLEAQANGIPVLATDLPALRETVGPGGTLIDPEAPLEVWVEALGAMLDDPARYRELVAAARAHAARPDVDPDRVVDRFLSTIGELVAAGRAR